MGPTTSQLLQPDVCCQFPNMTTESDHYALLGLIGVEFSEQWTKTEMDQNREGYTLAA